jgi:hypothetical protein
MPPARIAKGAPGCGICVPLRCTLPHQLALQHGLMKRKLIRHVTVHAPLKKECLNSQQEFMHILSHG